MLFYCFVYTFANICKICKHSSDNKIMYLWLWQQFFLSKLQFVFTVQIFRLGQFIKISHRLYTFKQMSRNTAMKIKCLIKNKISKPEMLNWTNNFDLVWCDKKFPLMLCILLVPVSNLSKIVRIPAIISTRRTVSN